MADSDIRLDAQDLTLFSVESDVVPDPQKSIVSLTPEDVIFDCTQALQDSKVQVLIFHPLQAHH